MFIMLFRLYTVNCLKWIALERDYEYPLIYLSMFFLYIVSKWDQTDDIHLSRLSTSAVYILTDCLFKRIFLYAESFLNIL